MRKQLGRDRGTHAALGEVEERVVREAEAAEQRLRLAEDHPLGRSGRQQVGVFADDLHRCQKGLNSDVLTA
jgi:hypothetical protein